MDELNKNYDKIEIVNIEKEMRQSYINYAMSVIVARALPDVRDGLKPVHRRILYAMSELNLEPTKSYRKSARIVGDTMGKYHPHGNTSIYDAMVRMAQDFSMRYMLVDGHGNFGSMDGDGAAAERYTEARLTRLSVEMLADIEKDTVDFRPNFDETEKEPVILPSRFPNLLVNGSSGIAVGMATNIPPHNLGEVIDAVVLILDNQINEGMDTDIADIMKIIKGPDFPTGATILGVTGIHDAYLTGRGKVRVRATATIEPMTHDREQIVVTEIPYQVNKAKMVEKISDLVKEKRIDGISDLRDESNRNGLRVVIELKKDARASVVLNQLYKFTQMEESFGVIMLALVNDEPKVLNLKEVLLHYITHQKVVVTRRTQFELKKAQKRAHILEGLRIALDHIDEVIQIIRSSQSTPLAKERLQERFGLTEEQSTAIVDMRLRALTGLERDKIEQEYNEIMELIKELSLILSSEKRLYEVIREEILIIRTKYADERRTKIEHDDSEILLEDLIEEEQMVVTLSAMDYVKRVPLNTYRSQNRGGKGIMAMQTRDSDYVKDLFVASTHDMLLFFSTKGKVYRLKTYELPETGRNARGTAIVNLLELEAGERISAVVPVNEYAEDNYLVMTTQNGVIKRTRTKEFTNIRKGGLIALNIRPEDALISVKQTDGTMRVLVTSKNGMSVMFEESQVRVVGRQAAGVTAIHLAQGDELVASEVLEENSRILFVTARGFGKCTSAGEFRLQKRGGKGLKSYKITPKTGAIVSVSIVNDDDQLMMITSEGIVIRIRVNEISTLGRITQGVKLMNIEEGIYITGVAKINADEIDETEDIQPELEEQGEELEDIPANDETFQENE